jgi:hypothetical protein
MRRASCLEARYVIFLSSWLDRTNPTLIAEVREPPLELAIMDADGATECVPQDKIELDFDDGLKAPAQCHDVAGKVDTSTRPSKPKMRAKLHTRWTVLKSRRNCGLDLDVSIAIEPDSGLST